MLSFLGQMTYSVASPALDSTRTIVMYGASCHTKGRVSSISIGGSINLKGFLSSILLSVDKASSVKVPVANVTLSSSAYLLRENTDSFSAPNRNCRKSMAAACASELRRCHSLSVTDGIQSYTRGYDKDGNNDKNGGNDDEKEISWKNKKDENTGRIILFEEFSEELKELLPAEAGK
ncbi:hypothetical protein Tco_0629738 [Tanacetum coccineum]|uniref:Uncharacterized protein n=1 Tax=Tanacetum coccineum TaxID=301880 RepID=A0ABQ4WU07_9ASTR